MPETTLLLDKLRLDDDQRPEEVFLVEIYGGDIGRLHPIGDRATIGRDAHHAIAVDLPTVSRAHATLERRGAAVVVCDLGSTNGTFVNEQELTGETELRHGDLLQTGGAIFKLIAGARVEAAYYEEIYRLTIVDGLTGIHNRRYLVDFLEREVARASRHRRPLTVALFDADRFKEVNDTHGHLAGDAVLRELARRLLADVRRDELLARYGGEEMALVLPETDLAGAATLCERLRRRVADEPFEVDGAAIPLTVSIGVAALDEADDVEGLLAVADRRLYAAKLTGRDRVVVRDAEPVPSEPEPDPEPSQEPP